MQDRIKRVMIESAVGKALSEIRKKSKRELRNLVELGTRYARGRFQDVFFTLARHMLEDDDSPYYDIIFRLVNEVDKDILKTIGVNIGYNSWAVGAKKIRAYEQAEGHNVPWTILADFRGEVAQPLMQEDYARMIREGRELGIYTYIFFGNGMRETAPWLKELFKGFPECAFLLFADPEDITQELAESFHAAKNVLPAVMLGSGDEQLAAFREAMTILTEKRCMAAAAICYGAEDIETIMDGYPNFEKAKKEPGALAFLIRRPDCPDDAARKMNAFAARCKSAPKRPVFLVDFYEDIAYVDRVISTESCYLEIARDGALIAGRPGARPAGNLKDATLAELLKERMPKVHYSTVPVPQLRLSSLKIR